MARAPSSANAAGCNQPPPHHPQRSRRNPPALGQRQPPHLLHRRSRRRLRPLPRPAAASLLGRHRIEAAIEQWGKDFIGPVEHYAVDGRLRSSTSARLGTEVQMYSAAKPSDSLHTSADGPAPTRTSRCRPPLSAESPSSTPRSASPKKSISPTAPTNSIKPAPSRQFNKLFTERDLPQGKPYQWKADDGTTVEGMLIYPPGKFEAEASAHAHAHSRRPRRRRRQPLRRRLVPVGRARRHQRMAGLRAQLPRLHRIRRQVPHADRSANRLASRQRHSRRRRRAR